jgi:predicted PurR-regulated permease PerM
MDSSLPPSGDGGSRAQQVATGALAVVLLALGVFTLWNFLGALAWAAIFAIALWPLYDRALARFGTGRHNVVWPSVMTLSVALIFILPLGFVGFQLARESHAVTDWLHDAQQNGITEPDLLRHLPFAQAEVDDWWQQNLADPGSVGDFVRRAASGHVADLGRTIGEQVLRRLTQFVFTLLTLFFLFKDGHLLTRQMRGAAAHTFGAGGERVAWQIIASVRGTVNGLVLVGLGEGVLLGIVYAIAGVPQPTVLGALTAVAAMIPFAGPVVFCLAALLLAAQGAIAWAIALVAVGLVVTFVADHFVRPVLIGGATRLPFIWVLLGILGGVEMWGLLGLFLGPAIMAALILLWREWACEPEETA